jgi:hypothetical protein
MENRLPCLPIKRISFFILLNYILCFSVYSSENSKRDGLIWGSFYGDAFGGPFEFQKPIIHPLIKKDRALKLKEWETLSKSVKLVPYRIKKSAYGPWTDNAPIGTITDDSRHKILYWLSRTNGKITKNSLARTYTTYSLKTEGLYKEWLAEYSKSAWFIQDPSHSKAYPLERLWGGLPTQAGQMIFLLNALDYPSNAKKAYTETYRLNFFDQGVAKDYTSALVGAMAYALGNNSTWSGFKKTLKENDPYHYAKIPYLTRSVNDSLKLAIEIVDNSKGITLNVFKMLEEKLNAKTWWEAHTSFITSLAFLELAYRNNNPMAAFALVRSFGHDTDSYAQLIGAIIGSIHGIEYFNTNEIDIIKEGVSNSFGDVFEDN